MSEPIPFEFVAPARPERLRSPRVGHLGGARADIAEGGFEVTIGNRPIAVDMVSLYTRTGRELPQALRDEATRSRLWLVRYTLGVTQIDGASAVRRLGLRVAYIEQGGRDHAGVTILEALPSTEFITHAEGGLQFKADLRADGSAELPTELGAVLETLEVGGADVRAEVSSRADIACRLSFRVCSPRVSATGEANSAGHWQVRRTDVPLDGTHRFVHVLVVPRSVDALTARCSVTAWIGGFLFAVPYTSHPLDVAVPAPAVGVASGEG